MTSVDGNSVEGGGRQDRRKRKQGKQTVLCGNSVTYIYF